MSRVHVGATDVVCEIETPRRYVLGIATEEALVIDQVCGYLFGDLLDDDFCTQRTVPVSRACAVGIEPRCVESNQSTTFEAVSDISEGVYYVPINKTDLIVVWRVRLQ